MTKVFLLFYSKDYGDREDWSVFYTPCEVFSTLEDRSDRVRELLGTVISEYDDDVWNNEDMYLVDREIDNPKKQPEGRFYGKKGP